MASFFQPTASGNYVANDSRFEIYSNSVLSSSQLTTHWYQDLVIGLGSATFLFGVIALLVRTWNSTEHTGGKSWWKGFLLSSRSRSGDPPTRPPPSTSVAAPTSASHDYSRKSSMLKTVRSFELTDRKSSTLPSQCDLVISPLDGLVSSIATPRIDSKGAQDDRADEDTPPEPPSQVPLRYGSFEVSKYIAGMTKFNDSDVDAKIADVRELLNLHSLDGMVIELEDSNSLHFVHSMLRKLRQVREPVLLMANADAKVLDGIDLSLSDGIVICNANVLPNGQRRDFFRASRVRDLAARAKRQRSYRPDFLFAFVELYDVQPSAATLRRAYKLADFFGALISARPRIIDVSSLCPSQMPLSGFDWLKRSEMVWLQNRWSRAGSVALGHKGNAGSEIQHLDLAALDSAIPGATNLLRPQMLVSPIKPPAQYASQEGTVRAGLAFASEQSDIWNRTMSDEELHPMGSFCLRDELFKEQYEQLIQTQRRLKDLGMLHTYTAGEQLNLSSSLKKISTTTSHASLLSAVCNGLQTGAIQVYRGLDSGLTLPDNRGHAWGVADVDDLGAEPRMDIYLSQKNVNTVATLWHVFLSCQGVERASRYAEEMVLKTVTDRWGNQLPLSIERELDSSTEAELLSLVRRLSLQNSKSMLESAILSHSTHLLTDETTRAAWYKLHSRACLDDEVAIADVFETRLEYYTKLGAIELPNLDNVLEFHAKVEFALANSLLYCDRKALSKLSMVLSNVYAVSTNNILVDTSVDLYALSFFCALRSLAFEDIYLETTDRCPLFLSQQDQAGVFSELWVLGSQCEIYFGILPRSLGEMTYNRYRKYLELNPPPTSAWNGKEVFTAYSTTEPSIKLQGHASLTGSGSPAELPGTDPGYRSDEPRSTLDLKAATNKLGALSIFCFPAIIDVLLLTFLGRGFYLTAFMDADSLLMANYAILAALVMTGGITGWVGSSGGFYLFSVRPLLHFHVQIRTDSNFQYAFDNMTHFLVQRFSGAFVLTTVLAFCGFFAFSQEYSWFSGFVFVMYLYALTTFLNLLGMYTHISHSEFYLN